MPRRKKVVLAPKPVQTFDQAAASDQRLGQLRAEFQKLRKQGSYDVGAEEWMKECRKVALRLSKGAEPTAEQWIEAAEQTTVVCPVCRGSGTYYWGACVNGRMTHSGPCFRCDSQGRIGQEKSRRNWAYDQHRKVI